MPLSSLTDAQEPRHLWKLKSDFVSTATRRRYHLSCSRKWRKEVYGYYVGMRMVFKPAEIASLSLNSCPCPTKRSAATASVFCYKVQSTCHKQAIEKLIRLKSERPLKSVTQKSDCYESRKMSSLVVLEDRWNDCWESQRWRKNWKKWRDSKQSVLFSS